MKSGRSWDSWTRKTARPCDSFNNYWAISVWTKRWTKRMTDVSIFRKTMLRDIMKKHNVKHFLKLQSRLSKTTAHWLKSHLTMPNKMQNTNVVGECTFAIHVFWEKCVFDFRESTTHHHAASVNYDICKKYIFHPKPHKRNILSVPPCLRDPTAVVALISAI